MGESEQICPLCLRPKQTNQSGSLTQWISVCRCDFAEQEEIQKSTIKVCSKCKKQVGDPNSGSLTQWILQANMCRCEFPEVELVSTSPLPIQGSYEQQESLEDFEFLELDNAGFPVERFRPIEELGRGAAGTIYLCFDTLLLKKVAVKELSLLSDDSLMAFQQEAKALSKLNHPNIVKVLDFGVENESSPYMVMDYVKGVNFESYLSDRGTLAVPKALDLLKQAAMALIHAHINDVYHGDLKPANLIVSDTVEGIDLKIVDFGLVKLKQSGKPLETVSGSNKLAGTPLYMSADVAQGREYSAASEIYSVGCIAFRALTGSPPFVGKTAADTLRMHAEQDVPELPDSIPSELAQLIYKCLAKEPDSRFESAEELLDSLNNLALEPEVDKSPVDESSGATNQTTAIPRSILLSIAGLFVLALSAAFLFGRLTAGDEASGSKSKKAAGSTVKPFVVSGLSSTYSDEYFEKKYRNPKAADTDFVDFQLQPVTNKVIDSITHLPVKTLNISMTQMNDDVFKKIAKIRSLRYLLAHGLEVSAGGVSELRSLPYLSRLDLSRSTISDQVFEALSKFPALRRIDLMKCTNIHGENIGKLSAAPYLNAIDLTMTPIKFANLRSLNKPDLEVLDLECTEFGDEDVDDILHFKNLKTLVISGNPITDSGLIKLTALKKLSKVKALECDQISADGFTRFTRLLPACRIQRSQGASVLVDRSLPPAKPHRMTDADVEESFSASSGVKRVDLSTQNITDKSVDYISHHPVSILNLSSTDITDAGLEKISLIPTITKLIVSRTKITSRGIEFLHKCPNLISLGISDNNLDDTVFDSLSKLKNLKVLRMQDCKGLTGEGVGKLNELSYLSKLNINRDNAILRHLGELRNPRLFLLTLVGTNFKDSDVDKIVQLRGLKTLNLSGTQITDKGLMKLAALPRIRIITVTGCPGVTSDGIKRFNKLKPDCDVRKAKRDRSDEF